jgi:hypothetical protein
MSRSGRSRRIWDQKRRGASARIGPDRVSIFTRIREAVAARKRNPRSAPRLPGLAVESLVTGMCDAEKDRLALSVADRHSALEEALARNRRKYPTREFRLFAEAVRRYVERTTATNGCIAALLGPFTASIISGSNKSGYPARCSSRLRDWNASFFSATIRISTGTNRRSLRLPVSFCPNPAFAFGIDGGKGLLSPLQALPLRGEMDKVLCWRLEYLSPPIAENRKILEEMYGIIIEE